MVADWPLRKENPVTVVPHERPTEAPPLRERIAPGCTALVAVDMQNDYVSRGGATDQVLGTVEPATAIIPNVQALLEAARGIGIQVVYTVLSLDADSRWLSDPEYYRRRRRWGDTPVAIVGSWGQQIADAVAPAAGDVIVEKQRASAFVGTNLDVILRSSRISSIVVVGAAIYGCVLATALSGSWLDYEVTVVADAAAGWSGQLNDATWLLLRSSLGDDEHVVTTNQVLEEWSDSSAR
jgi:ureidoacrylate peracid hydrolase